MALIEESISPQLVPAGGSLVNVHSWSVEHLRHVTVTGIVGGTGPITGLTLYFQSTPFGVMVPVLVDSDFSVETDTLIRSLGLGSPTNIATGSAFQFTICTDQAIAQMTLAAKSVNGATLAVEVGSYVEG